MTRSHTFIVQAALPASGACPIQLFIMMGGDVDPDRLFLVCRCPSNEGKAILVLLPSETKMLPLLEAAKIPLKQISINPKHATAATAKVQAEIAADVELKALAQKAFKSYVKSVSLQPNKTVFDASALPLDAYAEVCPLHNHGNHGSVVITADCDDVIAVVAVDWLGVNAQGQDCAAAACGCITESQKQASCPHHKEGQ